jgi:hypothetical protein
MMYQGNLVSPAMHVVALQEGGSSAGTWKTFDLTIDYEFAQEGEFMDLSGRAVLSEHYEMNYDSVRKLFVYMFFLDEKSRVLNTANLVRNLSGDADEVMTFSHRYSVPPGTTSFSFGYQGTAREVRTLTSFYELPLKKK